MKFAILLYTLVALFYIWDAWREHKKSKKQMEEIDKLIDNLKKEMVDAEPVRHGRWKGSGMGDYYCSLCCEEVSGNYYPFCPHCGAKMDEVK